MKHLSPMKSGNAEFTECLLDLRAFEFRQIDGSHGVFLPRGAVENVLTLMLSF